MKKIIIILLITLVLFINCKNSEVKVNNQLVSGFSEMPKSLNYLINNSATSASIYFLVYETLLERDPDTLEYRPLLAKKWNISDDKKTFTFTIDERAKWANGTPVTADDVIFTYDTIMNPNNETGLYRSIFESGFESVTKINDMTVKFVAKNKRWNNFDTAAGFVVIPKAQYEGKDFNKEFNFDMPAGSGPYEIESVKADRYITIKKRTDYWGYVLPYNKGKYNFEYIKYKFVGETMQYEALKKGDIDFVAVYTAKKWNSFVKTAPPKQVKNNWILAKKVYNYNPKIIQHFYFNLRRKKFQDIRVRKALGLLLNIDLINDKLMFNAYDPIRSYFPTQFNHDKTIPLVGYDPEEARRLLNEAGWDKVDNEGFLLNSEGQRLEIEFLYTGQSTEKHLTLYKESCEKVGVKLNLSLVSAANIRSKVFIDHDFDMTWMAWSGGLFPTVETLWRSDFADVKNGNNIAGYKNKKVDKLIDQYLEEFDLTKRLVILREIDKILLKDYPTILLWTPAYTRILYWNKFITDPKILSKYGDESSTLSDWAYSEEKGNALIEAMRSNIALPRESINVFYDESLRL